MIFINGKKKQAARVDAKTVFNTNTNNDNNDNDNVNNDEDDDVVNKKKNKKTNGCG